MGSRLNCTLLVELIGTAQFYTAQSCLWNPFNGNNYPCAIFKGSGAGLIQLGSSNANLREDKNPKINFNSVGDPCNRVSDTDKKDIYSPLMRGLFHVIGSSVHCVLTTNLNVEGVIVIDAMPYQKFQHRYAIVL